MATSLQEFTYKFGTTKEGWEFNKDYRVFGTAHIAEQIIEWSAKKTFGESFTKKTCWGLEMTVIANEANPRILFALNLEVLHEFAEKLGPITSLHLIEYGITLAGPGNRSQEASLGKDSEFYIYLPLGQDNEGIPLFHYNPTEYDIYETKLIPLGAVDIGEFGFNWITPEEINTEFRLTDKALEREAKKQREASKPAVRVRKAEMVEAAEAPEAPEEDVLVDENFEW